ncbi:hypothetical protein OOK29_25950 [Streptomyces phaeochromogenes]|uniref:hypothetical protein n=1 Tax=Streptomyces phaeochromogenes TaxID=1923 RepID=UPI0022536CB1|nr:hypothetical protein [Streptomyces phaeochromogenes]MCX5601598.1 hypothetical protein [Streptomyces phaeochromogenes]
MNYFSMRKHISDPEPEAVEEDLDETVHEPDDEDTEEQPTGSTNPVVVGVLGPGAWISARFGTSAAWAVHVVAVWAIGFYGGLVATGIVIVWLLAVGLFVPREHLDRLTAAVERRAPGKQPKAHVATVPPGGEREVVRQLLLALIGEAHGVHLRTVLTHLQGHGQWEDRTVADLRVHLEALGIPVQPKVKVAGTPTRGVLRADLEALSPSQETGASPAPSPPV